MSKKYDEDQYHAEDIVRSTFMESPKAKKLVKMVKKEIKKDKTKIRKKIKKGS